MTGRCFWRCLAVLAAFTMAVLPGRATAAVSGSTDVMPQGVSWQSTGDSYSSGEGVFGNRGACAQSEDAYGPRTAKAARAAGWEIVSETFTACTGHLVEDYFNARRPSGTSLYRWGIEQGSPQRVDVLTMSFGGNDIGFADVIVGCLLVKPDSWGELLLGGAASSLTGCDESEADLNARIDRLLDPTAHCLGRRNEDAADAFRTSKDGFDCDLALEGRRGSIIDFYYDLVTQHLTDRGRLYVVGYPRAFADYNQWPRWSKVACQGVKRGDSEKLGRVAEHLNNKLREAVNRANQALGSEHVIFIDRFAIYRDGLHELCGTGEDWLNGVSTTRGEGLSYRVETSFHPNASGHLGTAQLLARRIDETFPRSGSPATDWIPLPTRGVTYAERDAFRAMLDETEVPANHDLDTSGRCYTIDVWGWSDTGDADIVLTYNPDLASHGARCGGDLLAIAYIVRDHVVVDTASSCDCGESQDAGQDFSRIRNALAASAASGLLLFTDSDGHEGWYVFALD